MRHDARRNPFLPLLLAGAISLVAVPIATAGGLSISTLWGFNYAIANSFCPPDQACLQLQVKYDGSLAYAACFCSNANALAVARARASNGNATLFARTVGLGQAGNARGPGLMSQLGSSDTASVTFSQTGPSEITVQPVFSMTVVAGDTVPDASACNSFELGVYTDTTSAKAGGHGSGKGAQFYGRITVRSRTGQVIPEGGLSLSDVVVTPIAGGVMVENVSGLTKVVSGVDPSQAAVRVQVEPRTTRFVPGLAPQGLVALAALLLGAGLWLAARRRTAAA